MKRKRKSREVQRAGKRQKTDDLPSDRAPLALLRKYYADVVTLRQYLASQLSKTRRRKIRQYGRLSADGDQADVARLLDTTLVGVFKPVQVDDSSIVEDDITLFTQQLSGSGSAPSLTPGKFKQSEVGFVSISFVSSIRYQSHRLFKVLTRTRLSTSWYGCCSEDSRDGSVPVTFFVRIISVMSLPTMENPGLDRQSAFQASMITAHMRMQTL
jgi:hypothetical protein